MEKIAAKRRSVGPLTRCGEAEEKSGKHYIYCPGQEGEIAIMQNESSVRSTLPKDRLSSRYRYVLKRETMVGGRFFLWKMLFHLNSNFSRVAG